MSSKTKVRMSSHRNYDLWPAPPRLSDITYILKPLENKYFELGVQLEVEIDHLKQLEGENSRRFAEMIDLWQKKCANCSWSVLADAVKRIGGYDNLARELRIRDERADGSCSPNLQFMENSEAYIERESEDTGYSSKGASAASGDSSGSEIEHFDKIPGCGCENPCSVYTIRAGECPRPTCKKVGIVRKRVQGQAVQDVLLPEGETEEDDAVEKFEKEAKRIRLCFAKFVNKICDSFEKRNVTKDRVILFLKNAHSRAFKQRTDEMTRATNLEQVLTIVIDQACSWFDYEVIKDLVGELGDEQDDKLLRDYEDDYKEFVEENKLPKGKKHIEVGSGARVGGKQLVIKIDKEWDEVNFNDLDRIRGNLASILGPNIRRRDLYLADIREGCIMMAFMITEQLAEELFSKKSSPTSSKLSSYFTSSQIKSFKEEGVIKLRFGRLSWNTKHQELPMGTCEATLQLETESHLANIPNAPRRSYPLNLTQSKSVLLHNHSPTTITSPLCQPPFIDGTATLGRVSETGRIMYMPQIPCHRHAPPSREQSSPCLPCNHSNSKHFQHSPAKSASGRLRLWSLTKSGSFKRKEHEMEDLEHSISELNDEGKILETSISTPCLPHERSNSQHSQAESASGRLRLWSLTESGSFKREEDGVEDLEHSISELDMTLNNDEGKILETSISTPCLPHKHSNSQLSQAESSSGRLGLWSLTESGSFKREEDGMEDLEHSICELDMMLNDDKGEILETSMTSQEESEGEEEESQQEAKKTHTASGFHTNVSFSGSSTSPRLSFPLLTLTLNLMLYPWISFRLIVGSMSPLSPSVAVQGIAG